MLSYKYFLSIKFRSNTLNSAFLCVCICIFVCVYFLVGTSLCKKYILQLLRDRCNNMCHSKEIKYNYITWIIWSWH